MGKTGITFEDGSDAGPAQGIYLHHIISRDISKPENLPISKCAPSQSRSPLRGKLGSEFLAQGDDGLIGYVMFTSRDGNFSSGYFLGANDKIMNQVDLVNYNEGAKNIYVTYEIEYVDGNVGLDAAATLMSVTGCNNMMQPGGAQSQSSINLNKTGVAVTESPKFPITKNGKIVAASKSSTN